MKKQLLSLGLCLALGLPSAAACTTMLVTPGASADHSMYVTHSNDAGLCDPSIVYVPAKDHPAGSVRPVYPSAIAEDELPSHNCYMTPRLVDPDRAPGYAFRREKPTLPLGWIPEAAHTYAYMDSDYGIMNEYGLMLGECTNHSRFESMPAAPGTGLFYAAELGRVALERCRTAREAVELMGSLIDTYGLYGTGETLLVADRQEGWVLEMQPVPAGRALWIAQRVPDGEFFVAANQFRIRDITDDRPDLIFNPELPKRLAALGWTVQDPATGKLDWQRSIGGAEDFHPYFSLRRVWRALSLAAPSLHLPAKVKDAYSRAYPFAVRPDAPLKLTDLIKIHRDAYEGTAFDMTKGPGAGLYASPYRYGSGTWQRAIACRITGYTWIAQNSAALPAPIVWISLGTPRESPFVPLAAAPLPEGYEQVDRRQYNPEKAWWTYLQTAELIQSRPSALGRDGLRAAMASETTSEALLAASHGMDPEVFAERLRQNARATEKNWKNLYGEMLVKYNQGKNSPYDEEHRPKDDRLTHY